MDAGDTHRQAPRYKGLVYVSQQPDAGSRLEIIIISSPGMQILEGACSPSCSFLTSQIALPHLCSLVDLLLSHRVNQDQARFNWQRGTRDLKYIRLPQTHLLREHLSELIKAIELQSKADWNFFKIITVNVRMTQIVNIREKCLNLYKNFPWNINPIVPRELRFSSQIAPFLLRLMHSN